MEVLEHGGTGSTLIELHHKRLRAERGVRCGNHCSIQVVCVTGGFSTAEENNVRGEARGFQTI